MKQPDSPEVQISFLPQSIHEPQNLERQHVLPQVWEEREDKGKGQGSALSRLRRKVPPTVAILEDDSQHVSHQQLVVVNNPQRLHLGVHVAALFHADGGKEQWRERGEGGDKNRLKPELGSGGGCLT